MISETAFLNCENLPAEMSSAIDLPWNFLGEITDGRDFLRCVCLKCSPMPLPTAIVPLQFRDYRTQTVDLRGHWFITGDMLEVLVFFGRCDWCGSVFWARRGPPFRRVRSFRGVLV